MGQVPITGTVCPFPYAFDNLTMDASLQCAQTCADALGARYIVLQVVCLLVSSIACLAYCYRMVQLYNRLQQESKAHLRRTNSALRKSLWFWMFIGTFNISFLIM